jgi:hypothetical protein
VHWAFGIAGSTVLFTTCALGCQPSSLLLAIKAAEQQPSSPLTALDDCQLALSGIQQSLT